MTKRQKFVPPSDCTSALRQQAGGWKRGPVSTQKVLKVLELELGIGVARIGHRNEGPRVDRKFGRPSEGLVMI
jgi:hypothetical protein